MPDQIDPGASGAWEVQEAKARFSEFLRASVEDGPQAVTRRGVPLAVLVSVEQWHALCRLGAPTLKDLLSLRTHELLSSYRLAGTCAGARSFVFAEPMLLLDTNVVSELRRVLPQRAVLAWIGHDRVEAASSGQLQVVRPGMEPGAEVRADGRGEQGQPDKDANNSVSVVVVGFIPGRPVPRTCHSDDAGSAITRSSRRDSFNEDPSFGGSDLEIEVAEEVHFKDAVDAMTEVGNVCVHVRYREAERRELCETNDIAMFLCGRGTDDTAGRPGCRRVTDRFGDPGNECRQHGRDRNFRPPVWAYATTGSVLHESNCLSASFMDR